MRWRRAALAAAACSLVGLRPCRRVVVVFGVLALATSGALAGDAPQVGPGSRVRVKVSTEKTRLVGTVLALDDNRLNLRIEDEAAPRVFAREEIVDLDVSAGRRSVGKRALLGAGFGAGTGALMGFAATGDSEDGWAFAAAGAVYIGAAGALIGMLAIPGEKWRDVPLENVRLSLYLVPGRGVGLSLTVDF